MQGNKNNCAHAVRILERQFAVCKSCKFKKKCRVLGQYPDCDKGSGETQRAFNFPLVDVLPS